MLVIDALIRLDVFLLFRTHCGLHVWRDVWCSLFGLNFWEVNIGGTLSDAAAT